MGMFHAKWDQCWDTIPCNCEAQRERDQAVTAQIRRDEQRARDKNQPTPLRTE